MSVAPGGGLGPALVAAFLLLATCTQVRPDAGRAACMLRPSCSCMHLPPPAAAAAQRRCACGAMQMLLALYGLLSRYVQVRSRVPACASKHAEGMAAI